MVSASKIEIHRDSKEADSVHKNKGINDDLANFTQMFNLPHQDVQQDVNETPGFVGWKKERKSIDLKVVLNKVQKKRLKQQMTTVDNIQVPSKQPAKLANTSVKLPQ